MQTKDSRWQFPWGGDGSSLALHAHFGSRPARQGASASLTPWPIAVEKERRQDGRSEQARTCRARLSPGGDSIDCEGRAAAAGGACAGVIVRNGGRGAPCAGS